MYKRNVLSSRVRQRLFERALWYYTGVIDSLSSDILHPDWTIRHSSDFRSTQYIDCDCEVKGVQESPNPHVLPFCSHCNDYQTHRTNLVVDGKLCNLEHDLGLASCKALRRHRLRLDHLRIGN